ncbi:MAG: hypothetical protein HY748_09025 [Elusimicrobia bacterium]|nr:hypothetical protein [Elusimicrobiota bacterium]
MASGASRLTAVFLAGLLASDPLTVFAGTVIAPKIAGASPAPRTIAIVPGGLASPGVKTPSFGALGGAVFSPGLPGYQAPSIQAAHSALETPAAEPAARSRPEAQDGKDASPLSGLLELAPLAKAAASKDDPGDAKESSRDNFYRAARLEEAAPELPEAAEAPAVEAGTEDAQPRSQPQPGLRPAKPSGLAASPVEAEILEKVGKEIGPILAQTDAPLLYEALGSMFGRLSAAQTRLFPEDVVSINRVFVVDTAVLNAFVNPIKAAGVRRSSNMVFITTGLLKKMLGRDAAKLREGLVRIAGVLSHELAHPLDNVDKEGILTNYGREVGSQAREVRADSEGAMIAKEAGYPVGAVYESLKRLFAGDDAGSALGSLLSTHPENDLRLAMQRLLLTLDRYEKGRHTPSYPEAVPEDLLAELGSVDKGARMGRFTPLRDLADALERLQAIADDKEDDPRRTADFNRVLLAMDALLAKRTTDLNDEEFAVFTAIAKLLAKPGSPDILDRKGMNKVFTRESHSAEFLAHPSHEAFMKKVAAYNSPRYQDWVKANFMARKSESYGRVESGINALVKIIPCEHIFSLFGDRIASDLPKDMRSHPNSRYVFDRSVGEDKSVEFQLRLAVFFHKRILSQLSEGERLAFFVDSTHDYYSYVFPQARDSKAEDYSLGILKQRGRFMGDPRLKALQQDYREVMRSIWDNRGLYGTLDLILAFNATDWPTVFAVLGIDPETGRGQMRQAVKQFTKTPAYAAAARAIKASEQDAFRILKLGHPMGKMGSTSEFSWLDDTLGPYLGGRFNDDLKADPELQAFARQIFAGAYYESRPDLFRRHYRRAFADLLAKNAGLKLSIAELGDLHRSVLASLVSSSRVTAPLADIQAETIDASPLPAEEKARLLKAVFLEGYSEAENIHGLTSGQAGDWLTSYDEEAKAVLAVLVRNGLVAGPIDLFSRLMARDDFRRKAKGGGYTSYASAVSEFKMELLSDLEAALGAAPSDLAKAAALVSFLETAVDPADGEYPAPETVNTPELRDLKARIAALAAPLDLDFKARLKLFRLLTGSGATPATDEFFRTRLQPGFDGGVAQAAGLDMSVIIEKGRIAGAGLQLSLTKALLEPEVERLESEEPSHEDLNRLIETVNAYVRHGSMKKDEYLESLAWRLDLSGRELGAFIEDEKSYNWRKANPMLLRFGSALSAEIARLSPSARVEFIEFLIEPQGRELPGVIVKELERNLFAAALAVDAAKERRSSPAQLKREAERAAYLMKLEIEAALIDASPFERIPLFELLLSAGAQALRNADDYPFNVTRRFLKYEPDSTEEKMLAAFLAVVPAHERTVSLAYLLSQAGGDKSSVKHIFEVFQTVGVKFGQMSSTWKLFGEEIARETASLKDSAKPMTKAQILEAARAELAPEEFSRIKRIKRVVGSASLKTVSLVELTDGREVVMLLRRPHAAEQIESNLQLGQAFLAELDRRGMTSASAMFDTVLDAVRKQLASELKMTREAVRIREAKALFKALNRSMRSQLNGWRFEVPDLIEGFAVRDTILFLEKANGATFHKLPPEARSQVGPLIAESSLTLLFRKGWFDADRHAGNTLIDPDRRVIHPIDFGQATDFSRTAFWRSDDRYELAQFLRALASGDADAIIRHGSAMAEGAAPRVPDALRSEILKVLSGGSGLADKVITLAAAFAEQGVRLDGKFTFGAFKGLMTLYGEGYVAEDGFRGLLAREITRLLKKKLPRTLLGR